MLVESSNLKIAIKPSWENMSWSLNCIFWGTYQVTEGGELARPHGGHRSSSRRLCWPTTRQPGIIRVVSLVLGKRCTVFNTQQFHKHITKSLVYELFFLYFFTPEPRLLRLYSLGSLKTLDLSTETLLSPHWTLNPGFRSFGWVDLDCIGKCP